MDAGEAEGIGREYLERWPHDRVIYGSLYPYRLPGCLAPVAQRRGPQISLA